MDTDIAQYLDGIADTHRALFDRVHHLLLEAYPGIPVVLSYGMPTYGIGDRSLTVGVWKHGLSLYGGDVASAAEEVAGRRLRTSRGTAQVRETDAASISDEQFHVLFAAALGPPPERPAGGDPRR